MDAQQEAPQETMCHIALLQPLEQYLFPIVLPLFGTLFPMNYKKQVLLIIVLKALPGTVIRSSFCQCSGPCSPCARGQIRAKSDPCSAVNFFAGNGSRGFFVLPDSTSFWSHFSAADCKTTKFSFETLCRCAELPAKRLDSARESAR